MLAKTPPMGWNSWNTFAEEISEELICKTADIMVEQGYRCLLYTSTALLPGGERQAHRFFRVLRGQAGGLGRHRKVERPEHLLVCGLRPVAQQKSSGTDVMGNVLSAAF